MKSRFAFDVSDRSKRSLALLFLIPMFWFGGILIYFGSGWIIGWFSFQLSDLSMVPALLRLFNSTMELFLLAIATVMFMGFAMMIFQLSCRKVAEKHKSSKKVIWPKLAHVVELPALTEEKQVASVLKTLEECATEWQLKAEFEEGKVSKILFEYPDEAMLFRLTVKL